MKKIMLANTIILLMLSIQCFGKGSNNSNNGDKDCYVPKGEIHCVTDLNTPEGQQKLKEFSRVKGIYQRESEKYLQKGRFGNEFVGFIDVPKWKDVKWFTDPDSSYYTLQITNDGIDIFTLDMLGILDKKGLSNLEIANKLIRTNYEGYLNAGHDKNNLVIKEVSVNGYKGVQLKVKNISGKSLVQNIFVVENKIYFATAEGNPKNIDEMEKLILRSWNPYK